MRRRFRRSLAHAIFFGALVMRVVTFLVCSRAANVLIRNGLLYARFAENLMRINLLPQPTNLGVGGSNPPRRANL